MALAFFSAGVLARPQTWEEVVDFLIGAWIVASPWGLGYDTMRDLRVNAVVVSLIVAGVAGWTALERSHYIDRWHKQGAANSEGLNERRPAWRGVVG